MATSRAGDGDELLSWFHRLSRRNSTPVMPVVAFGSMSIDTSAGRSPSRIARHQSTVIVGGSSPSENTRTKTPSATRSRAFSCTMPGPAGAHRVRRPAPIDERSRIRSCRCVPARAHAGRTLARRPRCGLAAPLVCRRRRPGTAHGSPATVSRSARRGTRRAPSLRRRPARNVVDDVQRAQRLGQDDHLQREARRPAARPLLHVRALERHAGDVQVDRPSRQIARHSWR